MPRKSKRKHYTKKTKLAAIERNKLRSPRPRDNYVPRESASVKLARFLGRAGSWIKGLTSRLNIANFLAKPKLRLPQLSRKQILWIVALNLAVIIGGFMAFSYFYITELPSPTKLSSPDLEVSTIIMDRHGTPMYEVYADTNRNPLALSDLPDYMVWATIAIEDKNFYEHWGFSVQGITRAFRSNLFGGSLQGGSTITQQLVKVGLLTPERTWQRKLKEAILTIATELTYSKDQIIEMYLNYIPYGGTAWGIEAASKTYFDKSARDLTLAEAAMLAGLPAAPSRFNPFSNPELSRARQQEVLRRMVEDGYITRQQADEASGEEITFATKAIPIRAPHFSLYIKDLLTERFGSQVVERGGLRVITTLDLEIQEALQASLSAEIASLERARVGNGAALVTKPNTGEILAMIGSKDYFDQEHDGQVNVVVRQRQPGSSIKPINYAVGLEMKLFTAGTMWLDVPTCFRVGSQADYCPKNYDNSFRGPVQTRYALGNSYNIPAVKALAVNSLETFIATASAMGINSYRDPSAYGLSLTLGGGELTMMEMATAFGTLANQGAKVPLQPILEIRDWKNQVIESYRPDNILLGLNELTEAEFNQSPGSFVEVEHPGLITRIERIIHRAPAYIIGHIMADNSARLAAFGGSSQLVIRNQWVAAKTGTTNNLRDNWTVGFNPEFLAVVWVGNNDNTPMNRGLVSGVTGAAPIFNDIMSYVLRNQESITPDRPSDIVSRPICTISGLVSNPDFPCATREELFWDGTQPGVFDQATAEIWVKEDSGFVPEPGETEGLTLRTHQVLSDPTYQDYCVDCPVPTDEEGKPLPRSTIVNYPLSLTPRRN